MKRLIIISIVLIALMFRVHVYAQTTDNGNITELEKKISEYQAKLNELNQQKNTLSSQIQFMDTQIYLTTLQIQQTEEKIIETEKEIENLSSKIEGLDDSLSRLLVLFQEKAAETYRTRNVSWFTMFFDAKNAADFINQVKYVKTVQDNNQKLIVQVQQAKLNYEDQKKLREKKKTELDQLTLKLNTQKQSLDLQKVQKQKILAQTQNDERVYQDLLSKAQAEYAAIQGIIAGAGTETELREVKKGDLIASIISGSSCNSSGTHLHFAVQDNGIIRDPFIYLKSIDNINDSGGDSWNPSGNWDWPISSPIKFHQGYGNTWFVRTYGWYDFHTGIDISSHSNNIYAISDGILYRGVYSLGCTLPYVRLVHSNSNIETLYLHVYPQT